MTQDRHPLKFFQWYDVILRFSAACLQIFTHVFKMGRKSKELSHDNETSKYFIFVQRTLHSLWVNTNSNPFIEIISNLL
jgi:hypothetical protein